MQCSVGGTTWLGFRAGNQAVVLSANQVDFTRMRARSTDGRLGRWLLAIAGFATPHAALAEITVEELFQSRDDALGNPLAYIDSSVPEISGARVRMMPGDSTGWHTHPVPTFGYLISGELTVEYATGESRVFRAGDGIIEAQHVAHNGHNRGTEPVEIVVFYAGAVAVANSETADPPRPDQFVSLRSIIPDLQVELRYLGSHNFIGRPISGYEADIVYLTRPAALALAEVQRDLAARGLGIKVFDGYRPQRAVNDFMAWAASPDDTVMKAEFYPSVDKRSLIPEGYIAERSGHSRGSTVDLTLIDLDSGSELDMGSPYDFFDPVSSPLSRSLPEPALTNRMRLREVMLEHGFSPLDEEWWHFTLQDEPFPDSYFDFPIR